MSKTYTLDTDDKRLIDDARQIIGGGSIGALADMIGKSEASLRHVLAGRASSLDYVTRYVLQQLIVGHQAQEHLAEGAGERWEVNDRAMRVREHLLSCRFCLARAIIDAERHFIQMVANPRRSD